MAAAAEDTCEAYAQLALSSYGPHGRCKAIQAAPNVPASVITSVSSLLFRGIGPVPGAQKLPALLIAGSALAQQDQFGDGGLACVALACRLVQAGRCEARTSADIHEACQALTAVAQWVAQALSGDGARSIARAQGSKAPGPAALHGAGGGVGGALRVPCRDLQAYLAVARGVLAPKLARHLGASELERLCMMVVEAFVRSVPAADTPVQAGLRPTATEVVRGAPFSASTLADGMLLPLDGSHDTALARGLLPNSGAVVALFTAPLDPSVAEGPGAGAGAGPGGLPSANAAAAPVVRAPLDSLTHQNGGSWLGPAESANLERILAYLEALLSCTRVDVVACQKSIHPAVRDWLVQRDIFPAHRLAAARVVPLATLAGCRPIASLSLDAAGGGGQAAAACCGQVDASIQAFGRKRMLVLRPCGGSSLTPTTLVLGCEVDSLADQLSSAVAGALKVLAKMAVQSTEAAAVVGGGAVERALALVLRGRLRQAKAGANHHHPAPSARQARVIEAFAAGLEELAGRLPPQPAASPSPLLQPHTPAGEVAAGCHVAYSSAANSFLLCGAGAGTGSDDAAQPPGMNLRLTVLDSAASKAGAMQRAVEAAIAVLRLHPPHHAM